MCREVFFTAWAAIDPDKVASESPILPEFSADELLCYWGGVRDAMAALPPIRIDEFVAAMEAELGGMLSTEMSLLGKPNRAPPPRKVSKRESLAAARRKEVARLSKTLSSPGEIAAQLARMQHDGKLDKAMKVGVEVVKKDFKRS